MSLPESEPLPEAAREQLKAHGDQLLRQLGAMRELEDQRIEIEPLDADAELSLRKHGDRLLADLEARRAPTAVPAQRKRRFPWVAIAASFVGVITCSWLLDTFEMDQDLAGEKKEEPSVVAVPIPVPEPKLEQEPEFPTPTTTVPEPSTALLALAGAMLLLRRRRH